MHVMLRSNCPNRVLAASLRLLATQRWCSFSQVLLEAYDGGKTPGGLPHGDGTAEFHNGCKYHGQFHEGRMHGRGRYVWPDGLVYEGQFTEGEVTGRGVYTWPDGSAFEGAPLAQAHFLLALHGPANSIHPPPNAGDVLKGLRHGQGRQVQANGTMYEGGWQFGKRHGHGVIVYDPEGKAYYEGGWVEDRRHGQGTIRYPDGNVYTGEWADDNKNGSGTMAWTDRSEEYRGEWRDGKPNGLGEYIWWDETLKENAAHAKYTGHNRWVKLLRCSSPGGRLPPGCASDPLLGCDRNRRYQGMFLDGARHGYGRFTYATGAFYEGQWVRNKKHGQGVYVFEDGTVYRGVFHEDRFKDTVSDSPKSPEPKIRIEDLFLEEPDIGGFDSRGGSP